MNMEVYKIGNAIVRIHGQADQENLKTATEKLLKHVIYKKRKKQVKNNEI